MFWGNKEQQATQQKELNFTSIHYEFSGGRSFWDIYSQNAQRPELHENEVKTHYIRSEFFLRGICANQTHLTNAQKVIGNRDRFLWDENEFDLEMSGMSLRMIGGGNPCMIIRGIYPPSDTLIKRTPMNAPAPTDIFIKVLSPIRLQQYDGNIDFVPPGIHHGNIKGFRVNENDPTQFDWFLRFNRLKGHGEGGHVWFEDQVLLSCLIDGLAVVIGCGLEGILTHIIGSQLPEKVAGWENIKSTEILNVAKTSPADLDRLEQAFLANSKELEPGRAFGWLSWIYHPTQGVYRDDARYAKYRQLGKFGD